MTEKKGFVAPMVNLDSPAMQAERQRAEEAAKKRAESSGKGSGPLYFYKFKKGKNTLLFLPPSDLENPQVFKKVFKMFNLKPDNEHHICIEKTSPELGLKCPVFGVLNDLWTSGNWDDEELDRMWPSQQTHWQCLDLEGGVEEREIWDSGKKVKVTVDFATQPQIVRLPPKCHDDVFGFFYDPMIQDFTNPASMVPIEIDYDPDKAITEYKVGFTSQLVDRKSVPARMPLFEMKDQPGVPDEVRIQEFFGVEAVYEKGEKAGKRYMKGSKLYNLEVIFGLPLEELQEPDGKVWKAAIKLKAFYDYKMSTQSGQLQTNVGNQAPIAESPAPVVPGTIPPHLQQAAAVETAKVEPPFTPDAQAEALKVEAKTEAPAGESKASPQFRTVNVPEDEQVAADTGAKAPIKLPGSPDCFGKFGSPIAGAVCDTCPYNPICKSTQA